MDYVHVYLISCFHDNVHILWLKRRYVSYIVKQMCKICDKNISKEKYEKLRKYLK